MLLCMNIAAIVGEIDAEIDKLRRIREIVQSIRVSAPPKRSKRGRRASQQSGTDVSRPQAELLTDISKVPMPQLIVLPARRKREYRPRIRPVPDMPKALAQAPSSRPIFVPRSAVPNGKPVVAIPRLNEGALEAVVRQNLMNGLRTDRTDALDAGAGVL